MFLYILCIAYVHKATEKETPCKNSLLCFWNRSPTSVHPSIPLLEFSYLSRKLRRIWPVSMWFPMASEVAKPKPCFLRDEITKHFGSQAHSLFRASAGRERRHLCCEDIPLWFQLHFSYDVPVRAKATCLEFRGWRAEPRMLGDGARRLSCGEIPNLSVSR